MKLLTHSAVAQSVVEDAEARRIATIDRISSSVVCVMPPDGQGGGSGVLISADGYAISNYHVTSGSGDFMKCGLNDGRVYDAVIVGIDPTGDVALIRLLGRDDFPFATPGNSDNVQVGDEVLALGNPFLLAADFAPTVTYGIVSGVHRYQYPANTFLEYTDCIQIDASINPGNSGGPLFDINGFWIGINGRASFEKRGRINSGAAYAISVNQVLLFIDHLKSGRIADHATTDFTVTTSTDGKVAVDEVSQVSEVWRRGLRPGDELLSFAKRSVTSANEFKNILGIYPDGTRVPLTFRNAEGIHTVTTRLQPLHKFESAPQPPQDPQPQNPLAPEPKQDSPAVPEQYQNLFEAREQFANYYFNRQLQDAFHGSLMAAIEKNGPRPGTDWSIELVSEDDSSAAMTLVCRQAGAGLETDQKRFFQPAGDIAESNEPPLLTGLLVASMEWHRLFQNDSDLFTEVVYHGSEVHLPLQNRVHVVIATHDGITTRWYFAADTPWPVAVDVQFSSGYDEARLVFDRWEVAESRMVPARIGVVDNQTEAIHWLNVRSFQERQPLDSAAVQGEKDQP